MANGTRLTLTEYISKFTDVATLSKLVTDVGPGFLTALSLVFLFNLFTGIPLLPYQRYGEIQKEIQARKDSIPRLRSQITASTRQRIACEAKAAALLKEEEQKPAPERARQIAAEKKQCEKEIAEANKQEEAWQKKITDAKSSITTLDDELRKAGSLSENMKELDDHAISVLFISLIFGVILSQAAGQMFYNRYRRRLWSEFNDPNSQLEVPPDLRDYLKNNQGIPTNIADYQARGWLDAAKEKAYEEIVKNYYRYLEICMNMIAPTSLFVVTLTALAVRNIDRGEEIYWFALVLLAVFGYGGIGMLYTGGYDYFVHYRLRIAHFIRGLWEERHPPGPPQPQPPPAPAPAPAAAPPTGPPAAPVV